MVDFDIDGVPLRIIGAHLGLLHWARARQVEAILHAAHPVHDRPAILLGDTNDWRFGDRSAMKMFDPHLSDVDMAIASFPSRFPLWPLDRVLTNHHVTVYEMYAVESELARVASDHLPVKAMIGVTVEGADEADKHPQGNELRSRWMGKGLGCRFVGHGGKPEKPPCSLCHRVWVDTSRTLVLKCCKPDVVPCPVF